MHLQSQSGDFLGWMKSISLDLTFSEAFDTFFVIALVFETSKQCLGSQKGLTLDTLASVRV